MIGENLIRYVDITRKNFDSILRTYLGILSKKYIFGGPRYVRLSINAPCNHNCVMCLIRKLTPSQSPKTFTLEMYKNLIDEFVKLKVRRIDIMSDGEPLLSQNIEEIINYITKKSKKYTEIQLTTNGTKIYDFGMEFFIKNTITLRIGLHAGNFLTWAKIHRPKTNDAYSEFEKLVKSIKFLSSVKGPRVILYHVLNILNFEEIDEMVEFALETRVNSLQFGLMIDYPELQLKPCDWKKVQADFERLMPVLDRYNIKHNFVELLENVIPSLILGKKETTIDFYRNNRCYVGWLETYVLGSGNVVSCGGGYPLGNIFKNDFSSIWRSYEYRKFRTEAANIVKKGNVNGCKCFDCCWIVPNALINKKIIKLVSRLSLGLYPFLKRFFSKKTSLPCISEVQCGNT